MNKEIFFNMMRAIVRAEKYINEAIKVHLDLIESPLYNSYCEMTQNLLDCYFTLEGFDLFYWFAYEHHNIGDDFDKDLNMLEKGQLHIYDENNNDITIQTIDDLWEMIKEFIKN